MAAQALQRVSPVVGSGKMAFVSACHKISCVVLWCGEL